MATRLEIVYRDLSVIKELPGNAKLHATDDIRASIRDAGFIDPIGVHPETLMDLDGNGRLKALRLMWASGEAPPKNVLPVTRNGPNGQFVEWQIPTVDIAVEEHQQSLVAARLNRVAQLGGFDERALYAVLASASESGQLPATGYDAAAFSALAERFAPPPEIVLPDSRAGASQRTPSGPSAPNAVGASEPATGTANAMPVSHVRMVQLFLNTETQPVFLAAVQSLMESGTLRTSTGAAPDNLTDAVFCVVLAAADALRQAREVPSADA